MLLKSLLGIDPKAMQETISGLITQVREIHAFMQSSDARLSRIETHLGIKNEIPALTDETKNDWNAANG